VPQYCDCASLHRVSLWLLCDGALLRGIVFAVNCSCVCVLRRCVHACVTAVLQWGCLRVFSGAAAFAGSHCCELVRHVSCDRACRSRSVALLDCNTVLHVLCARSGCIRRLWLWAGVPCRGLCYYRGYENVEWQCSDVRICGAVWLDVSVRVTL
jgi:hypothetical protein